jgi:hypothetical protein
MEVVTPNLLARGIPRYGAVTLLALNGWRRRHWHHSGCTNKPHRTLALASFSRFAEIGSQRKRDPPRQAPSDLLSCVAAW